MEGHGERKCNDAASAAAVEQRERQRELKREYRDRRQDAQPSAPREDEIQAVRRDVVVERLDAEDRLQVDAVAPPRADAVQFAEAGQEIRPNDEHPLQRNRDRRRRADGSGHRMNRERRERRRGLAAAAVAMDARADEVGLRSEQRDQRRQRAAGMEQSERRNKIQHRDRQPG